MTTQPINPLANLCRRVSAFFQPKKPLPLMKGTANVYLDADGTTEKTNKRINLSTRTLNA